ncbi:hypothetical protein NIES4101_59560 [Calothrix sp. NIES-4101]|nr:hypothetical protein NIES4101_59560 [Calothrix sp. NIES-4101]
MLKTLLVITIGILPSLFSLWIIRKAQWRTRARLRQASASFPGGRRIPRDSHWETARNCSEETLRDRYYLEGVGYLIGDISCQFNARSGYIRCAVNPSGPCHGCRFYEQRESTYSETSM